VPLARALSLLYREASNPHVKFVWGSIHEEVIGGKALADSLAEWPKTFSGVYIAMIRAGEQGGFLEVVLSQIADFRTAKPISRARLRPPSFTDHARLHGDHGPGRDAHLVYSKILRHL